jgi:hypothetical protein
MEIEHEDEIGRCILWRRRWFCPRCTYVNDSADRDGIASHKSTHALADKGIYYHERSEDEAGGS